MKQIPMLEKFAAQSLVEHEGELIFSKEKFAELIVRECCDVAVFKDSGTISTAQVAGYMAAGRATAAEMIREHFGINKNEFICPKCGVDRFKVDCPNPNRLECGIKVEAQ